MFDTPPFAILGEQLAVGCHWCQLVTHSQFLRFGRWNHSRYDASNDNIEFDIYESILDGVRNSVKEVANLKLHNVLGGV
jgi:hypothetical protein